MVSSNFLELSTSPDGSLILIRSTAVLELHLDMKLALVPAVIAHSKSREEHH